MAPIVYAIASAAIVLVAAALGPVGAVIAATACIVYNIRSVEEAARQRGEDREAEK